VTNQTYPDTVNSLTCHSNKQTVAHHTFKTSILSETEALGECNVRKQFLKNTQAHKLLFTTTKGEKE